MFISDCLLPGTFEVLVEEAVDPVGEEGVRVHVRDVPYLIRSYNMDIIAVDPVGEEGVRVHVLDVPYLIRSYNMDIIAEDPAVL